MPLKVSFFITNSTGEIDFLLPVIQRSLKNSNHSFRFIFTNEDVYKKFLKNGLNLSFCAEKGISYVCIGERWLKLLKKGLISKALFLCYGMIFGIRHFMTLRYLLLSQVWTHEQSGASMCRALSKMGEFLHKDILIHQHSNNIEIDLTKTKRYSSANSIFLLTHIKALPRHLHQGFKRVLNIGFPKFYPEWLEYLQEYQQPIYTDHVVIYSRGVSENWMDEDNYAALLSSSIKLSRSYFPKASIVIKPHPREDLSFLKGLLSEKQFQNVEISSESSAVLAMGAIFSIGFFTSAVFDSYAMGVPSVDYYFESKNFRKFYPNGRVNEQLELDVADSTEELEAFIKSVYTGTYELPEFLKELTGTNSVDLFSTYKEKYEIYT